MSCETARARFLHAVRGPPRAGGGARGGGGGRDGGGGGGRSRRRGGAAAVPLPSLAESSAGAAVAQRPPDRWRRPPRAPDSAPTLAEACPRGGRPRPPVRAAAHTRPT